MLKNYNQSSLVRTIPLYDIVLGSATHEIPARHLNMLTPYKAFFEMFLMCSSNDNFWSNIIPKNLRELTLYCILIVNYTDSGTESVTNIIKLLLAVLILKCKCCC